MELIAREQLYVRTTNQEIIKDLKGLLDKPNPEYLKKKKMGYPVYDIKPRIVMYRRAKDAQDREILVVPRGTGRIVRDLCKKHGEIFKLIDQRTYTKESIDVKIKNGMTAVYYQNDAVEVMDKKQQGMIEAPCGCLVGETEIRFNRGGKGFSIGLEHAYKSFNGLHDNFTYNWRKIIPTYVRAFNGERIQLHLVDDIVYSGDKEVYEITLENGLELIGTGDHEIMTESGWWELLRCKDEMVMCDNHLPSKLKDREDCKIGDQRIGGLNFHPYARTQNKGTNRETKLAEIHRLVYEAEMNKMDYDSFLNIIRNDEDMALRLIYIDPSRYHIHHKDENHFNNEPSNLEALTIKEHKKKHAEETKLNFNQGVPTYSKCVKVEYIGIEKTYDIICKDPHRNFVANGMVVHNSGKTVMGIFFIAKKKKSTLVVVHTLDLMMQWKDRLKEFLDGEYTIGQFGNGKKKHGDITIAMIQTLGKLAKQEWREFEERYSIFIGDESHHFGADTYMKVMNHIKAKYAVGLTATPNRKDGKNFVIHNYLGPVIHTVPYHELETAGRAVTCKVNIIKTGRRYNYSKMGAQPQVLSSIISKDAERNKMIVEKVCRDLDDGRIPMILTERKFHATFLQSLLKEKGLNFGMITGAVDSDTREKIKSQMRAGKLDGLVANKQIAAEGLDIVNIASVHIAFFTSNDSLLKQIMGRGRRVDEGKEYCRIWLYRDFIYNIELGNNFNELPVETSSQKYGWSRISKFCSTQGFEINITDKNSEKIL